MSYKDHIDEDTLRKVRDAILSSRPISGQTIRGFDEQGYFEFVYEVKPKKFKRYKRKKKEAQR